MVSGPGSIHVYNYVFTIQAALDAVTLEMRTSIVPFKLLPYKVMGTSLVIHHTWVWSDGEYSCGVGLFQTTAPQCDLQTNIDQNRNIKSGVTPSIFIYSESSSSNTSGNASLFFFPFTACEILGMVFWLDDQHCERRFFFLALLDQYLSSSCGRSVLGRPPLILISPRFT